MSLLDNVARMIDEKQVTYFTLEKGQGESYSHMKPTLYGHGTFPRSSVLAGRPKRVWVENWETWDEANNAIARLDQLLGKRFICREIEGTSHIPIEQMVSHLPDDDEEY